MTDYLAFRAHCTVCHQDYYGVHSCGGAPTPCGPNCRQAGALTEERVRQIVHDELVRVKVITVCDPFD